MAQLAKIRSIAKRANKLNAEGQYSAAYELGTQAAEIADSMVSLIADIASADQQEGARFDQHHAEAFSTIAITKVTGRLLLDLADYSRALPLIDRSVRLLRQLMADDLDLKEDLDAWRELSLQLSLQAEAQEAIGELAAAAGALEEALSLREAVVARAANGVPGWITKRVTPLMQRHEELVGMRLQLADLLVATGELDRADGLLASVRDAAGRWPYRGRPDVTVYLWCIEAGLARSRGDLSSAEALLRRAVNESDKGLSNARRLSCLVDLAFVQYQQGNYGSAEACYRQALEGIAATYGRHHPIFVSTLSSLADVLAARNQDQEARKALFDAVEASERTLTSVLSVVSEAQRLSYLGRARMDVDKLLGLLPRPVLHEDRTGDNVLRAFRAVLSRKSLGLETSLLQHEAVLRGRFPAARDVFDRLSGVRMRVAQKTLAGPGQEGVEEHAQRLAAWRREQEELEEELARSIPELGISRLLHAVEPAAIGARLPEDGALVELVAFSTAADQRNDDGKAQAGSDGAHYLAFILLHGDRAPILVELGARQRIDRLVQRYRAVMNRPTADKAREGELLSAVAQELSSEVLAPLLEYLHGHRTWIIAPDGELTNFPMEILPVRKGLLAGEKYAISYVVTGRDLLRGDPDHPLEPLSPPVVAGAPNFDLGTPAPRPGGRSSLPLPRFHPLEKEAEEEVNSIADILQVQPLLGDEAVEGKVRRSAAPRILHLATHSYAVPMHPTAKGPDGDPAPGPHFANPPPRGIKLAQPDTTMVVQAGLALAGANTWVHGGQVPAEAEDGLLTADDILTMDLHGSELVALSACGEELVTIIHGEGVFGLRRSFIVAGAHSLLVSLWKVKGGATAELMSEFYRQLLHGQSRLTALRAAQRHIRSRDEWRHPRNWAAFVLVGDTGPLVLD